MKEEITKLDRKLLQKKYPDFSKVEKKLKKNYPVQYLIGNVDFYGYTIEVNKHVLIPRFETETLVEKTIKYIKENHMEDKEVLEIGTGSGCIAIALKKEIPKLNVTAIDKSKSALKVARKNATSNHVDITFLKKNLFTFVSNQKYDILISNPPYLKCGELIGNSVKYEPKSALYASHNGYYFYEYILQNHHKLVKTKCIIAFEIGESQGTYIANLAKKYFKKAKISIEKDLTGRDRYVFIINK